MGIETLSKCPICESTSIERKLIAKDYTTTQEEFSIVTCMNCGFVFTNPRPDIKSIGKYYLSDKYISHNSETKKILDRIYVFARKISLGWKYRLISERKKPGQLLDVGCGTGDFLSYLKNKNWGVTGIEPSTNANGIAAEKLNQNIYSAISEINNKKFNVITLWHVLEHIHLMSDTLQKIKSLLADDGTIFIAVPNHESPDAHKYKQYWAAYDVPRHLWHFSKSTMALCLQNEGLKVEQIVPMKLDSFYVSLLSEKYKNPDSSILSQVLSAVVNGLYSNLKASFSTNHSSLIYIVRK
jgi:2-polyprenyl-3-methyl-5-hydroxy-6-metoxy-1,4-benzoquinol methylase